MRYDRRKKNDDYDRNSKIVDMNNHGIDYSQIANSLHIPEWMVIEVIQRNYALSQQNVKES